MFQSFEQIPSYLRTYCGCARDILNESTILFYLLIYKVLLHNPLIRQSYELISNIGTLEQFCPS